MDEQCIQKFNLLSDPWIPVVYLNKEKKPEELSLLQLFECCHSVREITGDIPQQSFAIIRLLEAVMYRAYFEYRDPKTGEYARKRKPLMCRLWCRLWMWGKFKNEDIDTYLRPYLNKFKDGFNLFGSTPFYQIKDLAYTKREPDSVAEFIADVPKSKKFLFSLRDRQTITELTYAEAARWLVFLQAYDTAGIKTPVKGGELTKKGKCKVRAGKVYAPTGVIGTGWCGAIGGVYLEGANFFETLMLNWVLFSEGSAPLFGNEEDKPPWEQRSDSADSIHVVTSSVHKDPTGPVSLLTWQSRRIRLIGAEHSKNIDGVVISYGDTFDAPDRQNVEMWTPWRESEEQQKKLKTAYIPWMPRTHDPAKALWRGFSSLLAKGKTTIDVGDLRPGVVRWIDSLQDECERSFLFDASVTIRIHAQGMGYGSQSSTFADSVDDSFDFRPTILCHDDKLGEEENSLAVETIQDVILDTDKAVNCLVGFIMDVQYAAGYVDQNSTQKKKIVRAVKNNLREQAYSELDELFRQRIKRLSPKEDIGSYATEWREEVQKKLFSIARNYLASSERSVFTEHDKKSVGAAWAKFAAIVIHVLLK